MSFKLWLKSCSTRLVVGTAVGLSSTVFIACSAGGGGGGSLTSSIVNGLSFGAQGSNYRVALADAPKDTLTNVFVSIDHIDLLLKKGSEEGRLQLNNNFGVIDLLSLQNGLNLPFADLNLQNNVEVKQIRLVLKDSGNWIVRKSDGSICQLKTPSEQQTGLKLLLPASSVIESSYSYSLMLDFDVDHSVVDNGKGNCLLKPVIKVKSYSKIPQTEVDNGGQPEDGGGSVTPVDDGSGGSTGGDTSGGSGGSSGDTCEINIDLCPVININ